jgi:hypothetical protein
MRALSFGLVVLALGVTSVGSASAQSRSQEFDGDRSGPPPYFTGQPPRREPDRPPSWPPAGEPREQQQQQPSYQRAGPPPPMPDNERRTRVIPQPPAREAGPPPPPPSRIPQGRDGEPVARVAVGADQMVISIAEYRSLQDQARELQRMLGNSSRDFRETPPSRNYDPRETYR